MHQFYKKENKGNWFIRLIARAGFLSAPKGTTIGPIMVKEAKGDNRHGRRKSAAIWRRYGAAAEKVMARRGISKDAALRVVMG